MKKALTYSIIVGNSTCPNRCKICISRMTPDYGLDKLDPEQVNWQRFGEATEIARGYKARSLDASALNLIEPFLRSKIFRFCLTPYFEMIEEKGLMY